MNFEQILIRVGVDAKAVVSGLNKVTSFVKGWTTGLMHDIKGSVGRMFTAYFAVEKLKEIKDEILEVKRLSEETGAGSNFIQSLLLEAKISGTSIESLTMPLIHFNRIIGEAKLGIPSAIIQLKDMGVITDQNELSTLNYTEAMNKLAMSYDKIGDRAKRDALLQEAFGRSAFRLSPMFNKGAKEIEEMTKGSFFTKFSGGTISDFSHVWAGLKTASYSVSASIANIIDIPFRAVAKVSQGFGIWWQTGLSHGKEYQKLMKQINDEEKNEAFEKSLQNQAEQEGITVAQEKSKIITEQNDLLEKQKELSSQINDRNKLSISEMAQRTRKILGIPEPKNYTISNRDLQSLRIDTLEKQAAIAFEQGNDKQFKRLTSEALQARASFAGGKLQDVNPLGRTEVELQKVNQQLEPVKRMADLINNTHSTPQ